MLVINKKCRPLSIEEYELIIKTLRSGYELKGVSVKPKDKVAAVLVLEASLGMRVGDIIKLKQEDFVRDGLNYRLNIVEEKTKKERHFIVPNEVISFVNDYCITYRISKKQKLFDFTVRHVQREVRMVCDYHNLSGVSTHSFRKFFASEAYKKSGFDIRLVQLLLNHSSVGITQRYVGVDDEKLNQVIQSNVHII